MNKERETLSKNLRGLIDNKGIDQKILSDYLGISEMSVSNWVNGVKYPRMGNVQKTADYFGVRKSDIIEESSSDYMISTSTSYTYIPTAISAGLPLEVEAITETSTISIADDLMGKHAGHSDIFITKIYGDSMNKIMPDGSIIAVKPTTIESLKDGAIVIFSSDYDYSVKHYYKQSDMLIFKPNSNNNDHHDQVYEASDNVQIHGKVVMYSVNLD